MSITGTVNTQQAAQNYDQLGVLQRVQDGLGEAYDVLSTAALDMQRDLPTFGLYSERFQREAEKILEFMQMLEDSEALKAERAATHQ